MSTGRLVLSGAAPGDGSVRAHFQHPSSLVETAAIGAGTKIWAFVHVLPGAVIGRNTTISDHCWIENAVRIGDNVTIKTHVAVPDGVTIEDDAFIGPNVTFMNDRRPSSNNPAWTLLKTRIGRGATIAAAANILPGVTLGARCFVGVASVVTRDVPAHALVMGNPARSRGWVCICREPLPVSARKRAVVCPGCGRCWTIGPAGVQEPQRGRK